MCRFALSVIQWSSISLLNLLCENPVTTLVSMHDMRMVQELFPRTTVMDEDLIAADGDTREILADEKFLNKHRVEKPRGTFIIQMVFIKKYLGVGIKSGK